MESSWQGRRPENPIRFKDEPLYLNKGEKMASMLLNVGIFMLSMMLVILVFSLSFSRSPAKGQKK